MMHLNATALAQHSTDYIAILNLATESYKTLTLTAAPHAVLANLHTHAIDLHQSTSDPDALTVFITSHRIYPDRATSAQTGADSVIEVFETRTGESELRWVKTVRHDLIRTPNAFVAMGETAFYVTNDHSKKVHRVSDTHSELEVHQRADSLTTAAWL